MSLFLPISTSQFHAKPMAIASITTPVSVHNSSRNNTAEITYGGSPPSPSSSSTQSDNASPHLSCSKSGSASPPPYSLSNYSATSSASSFSSSPNNYSRENKSNHNNILPPLSSSTSFYHPYQCITPPNGSNGSDAAAILNTPPLSLHERRIRNKAASAKYRAKKNQQHGEMRAMISSLTKENELLLRQLDHIQHENAYLKATCDKLRGKIIAQKMLKQYLVETDQHQQHSPGSISASDPIDSCYMHFHTAAAMDHRRYPDTEDKTLRRKRD